MREVLFRGKRISNSKWVEGFMYSQHFPLEFRDDFYIRCYDTDYLVIPETVGQYTGLTDKNGTKIFEGDIVSLTKWNGLVYKVVYDNCRYELHNDNETCCYVLSIYKSKDIIVIGNIHDNPEILKGGGENG